MVQVNNTPIVLRLHFKKVGRLQYVSHLDLVRTMHKVIVRAKLPLKYTEGFNPKPKMVFAAPLSIGTESYAEFVDIRLSERMDTDEAKRVLNENTRTGYEDGNIQSVMDGNIDGFINAYLKMNSNKQ